MVRNPFGHGSSWFGGPSLGLDLGGYRSVIAAGGIAGFGEIDDGVCLRVELGKLPRSPRGVESVDV